ncbi:MAG TPA: TadE family protein [Terracidiphilus sp.]|nr:TadE family protein [Terracidiphilus sp.]
MTGGKITNATELHPRPKKWNSFRAVPSGLARITAGRNARLLAEEANTVVEMAITTLVLFSLIFGIIEMCMCLYAYNFTAEAARQATRYAIVRGSLSCQVNASFKDCNLGPATAGNPLQTYVQGLGFPYASQMTVTPTWWSPSGSPGNTWTTACTTATDANGNACNQPGNAVKVVVTYAFPLAIPLVGVHSITLSSTSEMMVSE